MKKLRVFGFVSALVPTLLIFSGQTPVQAADSPQLIVTSPATGANFYWNAPQAISFELRGGWASQVNACGELGNFKFGFWGKMTYGSSKSLILHNFGGYAPFSTWDSVLTATGIRCSTTINGADGVGALFWTAPSPIHDGHEVVFDIGNDEGDVDEVHGSQKVDFAWMIDGKTFSSSIQAQEALVGIEYVGLSRGENIEYSKKYQVKISRPSDAPALDTEGLSDCEKRDSVTVNKVISVSFDCILNTDTTGLKSITVSTRGYVNSFSKSVSVNVVKAGTPRLDLENVSIELTDESAYKSEFVRVHIFGELGLEQWNLPQVTGSVKVCVDDYDCLILKTDPNSSVPGSFIYDRVFPHSPGSTVKWTVEANYDGVIFKESGEKSFKPIAKPVPAKPSPITSLNYSVPKSVKWGKPFTVSLTPKGKGSASCYIWFQATSPTNGRYDFTITAGKTTKVSIVPTYYQLAAWPISLRCWPKNWNNQYFDMSLGKILLTN